MALGKFKFQQRAGGIGSSTNSLQLRYVHIPILRAEKNISNLDEVSGMCTKILLLMAEIRHPPVEVGSLSHYLQGFIPPGRLFGISSINSTRGKTHMKCQIPVSRSVSPFSFDA